VTSEINLGLEKWASLFQGPTGRFNETRATLSDNGRVGALPSQNRVFIEQEFPFSRNWHN
jgi:hypothetical protein